MERIGKSDLSSAAKKKKKKNKLNDAENDVSTCVMAYLGQSEKKSSTSDSRK